MPVILTQAEPILPEDWCTDYMKEFRELSVGDKITYHREGNIIRITGAEREKCFCPFVDPKLTSINFCRCSTGTHWHTFATLLGKR